MQNLNCCRFFVKTACFRQETKTLFSKTTVSTTPKKHRRENTQKQKHRYRGVVPGFSEDSLYVFFSPTKNEMREHENKILPPTQSQDKSLNFWEQKKL